MTLKRRMTFVCLALGLILTAGAALSFCAAPSQPRAFSLESVLSAPFPSDLVASPRGDALAWVQDDQGRRNIWLAAAPEFKARAVTHFDRDDGLEISDLTFSRDGSILVFVRNQGPNRSGEFPNPTSSPQGAEQAVWAVKTAGGGPWRIGPGNGPCVSPAEDLVVFSQRGGRLAQRVRRAEAVLQSQGFGRILFLLSGRFPARFFQRPGRPQLHRGL
jgi:dipeptidyl aminopeptidase/acylaminoacyl peptidase